MTSRHGNTGRDMVDSGAWMKVGRKHYRHIDGAEIIYDCNRWGWQIVGQPEVWSTLWVARHNVEKKSTPCQHPPTRLYAWTAADGVFCVACCQCGAVLKGAA